MPRRNRDPRGRGAGAAAAGSMPVRPIGAGAVGWSRTEESTDGAWVVRSVPGVRGVKTYRCPGCDHEIPPGVGHVVAWPAPAEFDRPGGADQRRHWHTPCWESRHRRRPGRRTS